MHLLPHLINAPVPTAIIFVGVLVFLVGVIGKIPVKISHGDIVRLGGGARFITVLFGFFLCVMGLELARPQLAGPPPPTPTPSLAPTPTSSPALSISYSGSVTASDGGSSSMNLYSIQKYTNSTIKGNIGVNCPFYFCGITGFSGSVYPDDSIGFTMVLTNGVVIHFEGAVDTRNNTMRGTYSGTDQESGRWSVSSS